MSKTFLEKVVRQKKRRTYLQVTWGSGDSTRGEHRMISGQRKEDEVLDVETSAAGLYSFGRNGTQFFHAARDVPPRARQKKTLTMGRKRERKAAQNWKECFRGGGGNNIIERRTY